MMEGDPSPTGKATNLQVMDVMLKWADMNITKPKTQRAPRMARVMVAKGRRKR